MKKITVSVGATLKLAAYETFRVDVGYEEEISMNENISDAYERCWDLVREELKKSIEETRNGLLSCED